MKTEIWYIEMSIFFIDFEASGLGDESYPIQVGICNQFGTTQTWLIRPRDHWLFWDPDAERIHGLSRQHLIDHGLPSKDVALAVHEIIRGHEVYCSSPPDDNWWMTRLSRSAGIEDVIDIKDIYNLYTKERRRLLDLNQYTIYQHRYHLRNMELEDIGVDIVSNAEEEFKDNKAWKSRSHHDAGEDAKLLYDIWNRIRMQVDTLLTQT